MCCIILALDHPEYALVLASNRDEFLARPTLPLALHDFHPKPASAGTSEAATPSKDKGTPYLSGLDALTPSGGTWLGVTPSTSHLSFLTNISEDVLPTLPPGLKEFRSRGKLVKDWLTSGCDVEGDGSGSQAESIEQYLKARAEKKAEYVGYNLVVGRLNPDDGQLQLGYLTNRGPKAGAVRKLEDLRPSQRAEGEKKEAAVAGARHGFWTMAMSNDSLDDGQNWQKVCWGRERLAEILGARDEGGASSEEELVESLFEMLGNSAIKTVASRDDLKAALCVPPVRHLPPGSDPADPKTGPPAWYATRTSTVLLIRRPDAGNGGRSARTLMIERDRHALDPQGKPHRIDAERSKETERRFEVQLGGEA